MQAQNHIEYSYDNHGNRTARTVIEMKLDSTDFINKSVFFEDELYSEDNTKLEIENQLDDTKICIYPNPAKNEVNISITSTYSEQNTIGIYTITGQLINQIESSKSLTNLDISYLSEGTYMIIIDSGDFKYQQKIIKN